MSWMISSYHIGVQLILLYLSKQNHALKIINLFLTTSFLQVLRVYDYYQIYEDHDIGLSLL
jgi:hypothetical protein